MSLHSAAPVELLFDGERFQLVNGVLIICARIRSAADRPRPPTVHHDHEALSFHFQIDSTDMRFSRLLLDRGTTGRRMPRERATPLNSP